VSDGAELLGLAWQYHQAGENGQAEQLCLELLQADVSRVAVLDLLARIAEQTGRPDTAVAYLLQAAQCDPSDPLRHFSVGLALQAADRPEEAVASYRQALALQPDFPEAHNNLASALQACHQSGLAEMHCRHAIQLRPNYTKAYLNLGIAQLAQGRFEEAVACYHWVLQVEPDCAEAYFNLGVALEGQRRLDEAAANYQAALRVRPGFMDAIYGLGNVSKEQGKLEEAGAYYRWALELRPNHAEAHNNLGFVLAEQGFMEEAVQHYHVSLSLQPRYMEPMTNLGVIRARQGRLDEALHCYEETLRLGPDDPEARKNRAFLWLLQGNFSQGWPEYEWRWLSGQDRLPSFVQPRWDGANLSGRTILVFAEQGLGDTLQFIRYAPLVKQCGGTVIVQCHAPVERVVAGCAGIDVLIPRGVPIPAFDVQVPLLSLPGIFHTSLATIPAQIPYLYAEPELVEYWRGQIASYPGLRVGIVWQGSPMFSGDRRRSLRLRQLAPLAEVTGVSLFSLQVGAGSDQLATAGLPIIDLGSRFNPASLADLAAVLVNLDLLISVDTAPVHLAGALGVPVWVALPLAPDWRWLLDREDSPWYPTARLFRQQEFGNWDSVIDRMVVELRGRLRP
jgi:tetratricopeptide (TPR) repeat protein